jgi:hypothetical protein
LSLVALPFVLVTLFMCVIGGLATGILLSRLLRCVVRGGAVLSSAHPARECATLSFRSAAHSSVLRASRALFGKVFAVVLPSATSALERNAVRSDQCPRQAADGLHRVSRSLKKSGTQSRSARYTLS